MGSIPPKTKGKYTRRTTMPPLGIAAENLVMFIGVYYFEAVSDRVKPIISRLNLRDARYHCAIEATCVAISNLHLFYYIQFTSSRDCDKPTSLPSEPLSPRSNKNNCQDSPNQAILRKHSLKRSDTLELIKWYYFIVSGNQSVFRAMPPPSHQVPQLHPLPQQPPSAKHRRQPRKHNKRPISRPIPKPPPQNSCLQL